MMMALLLLHLLLLLLLSLSPSKMTAFRRFSRPLEASGRQSKVAVAHRGRRQGSAARGGATKTRENGRRFKATMARSNREKKKRQASKVSSSLSLCSPASRTLAPPPKARTGDARRHARGCSLHLRWQPWRRELRVLEKKKKKGEKRLV